MWLRFKYTMNFQSCFRVVIVSGFLACMSTPTYADVCVWRNPERTMSRIFPQAGDYKTITKIINEKQRAIIEKRLGQRLTAGESKDWIYYQITGKEGETLGYITADAEKGEYGVIEMVAGITPDGKVKDIYIQRSRERDKEFKSREFLDQFRDKTVTDPIGLLFSIEPDLEAGLDSNEIPEKLRQTFENNGFALSQEAVLLAEQKGNKWRITDSGSEQTYNIVKEKGQLNVYKIGNDTRVPGKSVAVNAVILGVRKMLIFYDDLARKATKWADVIGNPDNYQDKEVVLEGEYKGSESNSYFFYKEGDKVIKVRSLPPPKIETGKQVRIYAIIQVVGDTISIESHVVRVR